MSEERPPPVEHRDSPEFATTHWSLVLAAGRRRTTESNSALERLCAAYWPPLHAYVRCRIADRHEAQDLTQAFFERLLEKEYLAEADPERGRFRAFLLTAFKHFLSKEWEKAKAQKRGGGRGAISFDFVAHDAVELTSGRTAEQIFEREWTIALLARVMHRLQREMERAGKGTQFQLLKDALAGDVTGVGYAEAAMKLGLTEAAARMTASRLRSRYRELLRDEIAQTLSSRDDVEEEIRHLFQAFENR